MGSLWAGPVSPAFFWLTVAVLATGLVVERLTPRNVQPPQPWLKAPVLALELPREASDMKALLGPKAPNPADRRPDFAAAIYADFAFIGAYSALWGLMGARTAGAVGYLAVVVAAADVAENLGMLRSIAQAEPTEATARWTRSMSLVKWTLLGVLLVTAACAWSPASSPGIMWMVVRVVFAVAYGAAGLLYVVGALSNALGAVGLTHAIGVATAIMVIVMPLQALYLWFREL